MKQALYKIYNARELDHLTRQFEIMVPNWAAQWFHHSKVEQVSFTLENVFDVKQFNVDESTSVFNVSKYSKTLLAYKQEDQSLLQAMLGDGAALRNGDAAHEAFAYLIDGLFVDLISKLLKLEKSNVGIQKASGDVAELCGINRGAGALLMKLSVADFKLNILLPFSETSEYLKDVRYQEELREACFPCRQSVLKGRIRLGIKLGSAVLTVQELRSLSVGDVVKMDTKVNQPVMILNSSNEFIAKGYLGEHNGKIAVSIAAY